MTPTPTPLTRSPAAPLAEAAWSPLRGKNLGLLCETDSSAATLFERAAIALGAQVVRIRPSAAGLLTPAERAPTARMLGRLYDAVECQGLAPALVQQLRSAAGVPVFDGLAGRQAEAPEELRLQRLQAELLQALG